MAGRNTYFISDLHLGAKYMDEPLENERRVCRFLDSIKDDAARLFLLGDILDYWYEYKYVVPRGYIRFLGKLAELADAGVEITWVVGNHDVWLFDYLRDQIGLTVLTGHTVVDVDGRHFLISHGDDVGVQPVMYRFTRWCFHNRVCQFLYAAIHPRWTYPIATGWSNESRKTSSKHSEAQHNKSMDAVQRLIEFSTAYAASHPQIDAFFYGHVHYASDVRRDGMPPVILLGNWLSSFSYAVATPDGEISLKYYNEG